MNKSLLVLLSFLIIFSSVCLNTDNTQSQSFLNWLINHEHIAFLNPEIADIPFKEIYPHIKNATSLQIDSTQTTIINGRKTLSDFLNPDELEILQNDVQHIHYKDWAKSKMILPAKFMVPAPTTDKQETIYRLSRPIFLSNNKAVISELFWCGIACGNADLLICEFKDETWHIVARFNLWSE